jgi:cytochrome c oxidase subunit II
MSASGRLPIPSSTSRRLAATLAIVALTAFACGSEETQNGSDSSEAGGGSSEQIAIVASDFEFDTSKVEVEPGSTTAIDLQNEGEAEHSFTVEELDVEVEAEGGESATGNLEAPDEDVTYEFFCEYHPDQMRGTLVVGAGGEAPAGGGDDTEKETEKEDDGGTRGGYDY